MNAPLLISLPHGLNASGVTSWAVRLANAVARFSEPCASDTTDSQHTARPVALILHAEPPGQQPIDFAIDPRVEIFDARDLPPLDTCNGDLSPYLPVYRLAIGVLAARAPGSPVVCSPNLLGDSYGILAELSRQMPDLVRTIAVHHSDIRYNDLVCAHYAHAISTFVGVSERITHRLGQMFPTRGPSVFSIPYGVEVPAQVQTRKPLAGRPIRLLYTGRMDHEQKRVRALPVMSDELNRLGLHHETVLLGDGPAATELDALCSQRQSIRRFSATNPAGVASALKTADCFVLPSRYEGLSVALLEALAHGCIPVLTPSQSGTAQLARDGKTGFLADAGPDADDQQAGLAMARAVERVVRCSDSQLHAIRERGRALVQGLYSIDLCARRYGSVIDRVAQMPPRPWPAHTPAAFTGSGSGGSGTVPPNAAARLGAVLESLAGRSVAIFGTGRHTLELQNIIMRAPVRIVAFLDDDAGRQGEHLWGVPIVAPEQASACGASDIVISSWLHHDAMLARCAGLEAAGVRVHRVYASAPVLAAAATPG